MLLTLQHQLINDNVQVRKRTTNLALLRVFFNTLLICFKKPALCESWTFIISINFMVLGCKIINSFVNSLNSFIDFFLYNKYFWYFIDKSCFLLWMYFLQRKYFLYSNKSNIFDLTHLISRSKMFSKCCHSKLEVSLKRILKKNFVF